MKGVEIKTRTKQDLQALKYNISMLKSLSKDILIGIILGINEERLKE